MKPIHLVKIVGRFEVFCIELEKLVSDAISIRAVDPERSNVYLDATLVRLLDRWSSVCRQVILSSAHGEAIGRSATAYRRPPHIPKGVAPIEWLQSKQKPKWNDWEPKWHSPEEAIKMATVLGISNAAVIANGLGASLHAESLRVTRNAIAHRLPNTYKKLAKTQGKYGITKTLSAYEFVLSRVPPDNDRVIEVWISDLRSSIMAAAD